MLVHVCREFQNIEILYEKVISGSYIIASGCFELVIKKGKSVLCLLEAKEDFGKGKAQCLVGCEAVSDSAQCSKVLSNYFDVSKRK